MRTRATSPHEIDTKWGLDHLAHSSRNDRPALASNGRLLNTSLSAGYPLLRSSFGKPIDMTHAVRPVQWFLFVVLTTSIVSTYCWLMGRLLPPLRNEPFSLLLLPMTAISGVIASLVYPVLHHQQSRSVKEPHGGGPAAFDRSAVAAGGQVGGGGEVGAVSGMCCGPCQSDR